MTSPQVCVGCLSSDRKLNSLGSHFTLFRNIVEQNAPKAVEEPDKLVFDALFCWECRQTVANIQKFLANVTRSQKILKRFSGSKLAAFRSFSGLKIVNPDEKKIKKEVIVIDNLIEVPIIDQQSLTEENNIQSFTSIENNTNTYIDVPDDDDDNWAPDNTNDDWDNEDDQPIKSLKTIKKETGEKQVEIKKELPLQLSQLKEVVVKINGVEKSNSNEVEMLDASKKDDNVTDSLNKRKICTRIPIGDRERASLMKYERMSEEYNKCKFKCKSCIIGFTRELTYVKHRKLFHNSSNPHVCDVCKSRFATPTTMKLHKQSHYYKYQCNFCHVSERQQSQIYRHYEMVHHGKIRNENPTATLRRFPRNENPTASLHRFSTLTVSRRIEPSQVKEYQCHECSQKCVNKASMARHIARAHGSLRCSYCSARFISRPKLNNHMQQIHSRAYKEQCYCVECDHQFSSLEGYKKHIKESVKHNPEKKSEQSCAICNVVYQSKSGYNLHMRIHHSEDSHPYKCDICGRSFPFKGRLESHIEAVHPSGEKRPKPKDKLCPHCGRGFNRSIQLTHHIRTHTGEKPYYCVVCQTTYNQKGTLVSHYRAAHKLKLMFKQIKGYGELTVDLDKFIDVQN